MENKKVIYNDELMNEYTEFFMKRSVFEKKINLHSYFLMFSEWLYYYINADDYRIDLVNSLKNSNSKYRTKLDIDIIKLIAHDFFYDLGTRFGEDYDSIINNEKNIILSIDKDIFGKKIQKTGFSSISDNLVDGKLYGLLQIKNYDSIETLYSIVHECTHSFSTVDNKYNQSIYTILEVPSYFSESLLSDYLLKNYKRYNLNKKDVIHDVNLWKILRYFDYIQFEKDTYRSDYFLGLVLNSSFDNLSISKKKQEFKLLLYYLKLDRIDIALKCIDFNLGNEKEIEKSKYLKNMKKNLIQIIKELKGVEYDLSNDEMSVSHIKR